MESIFEIIDSLVVIAAILLGGLLIMARPIIAKWAR